MLYPAVANYRSELANLVCGLPPTSLQNWRLAERVASNFPSELAGFAGGAVPPTSLQNWRRLSRYSSDFPSELADALIAIPPTSLQNWRQRHAQASNFPSELAGQHFVCLQLPFRTGH
jgi:hypothetical protein